MKKIYLFLSAALITTASFAQFAATEHNGRTPLNTITKNHHVGNKTQASFYLDYDANEEQLFPSSYARYIWDIKDYPTVTGDTASLNDFVVAFDSIFDYSTFTIYNPGVDYTNIMIDTIFMAVGHTNNSSQANTITVTVIPLDGTGYPQVASPTLWDTTITTSTGLSTGNNWLQATVLTMTPYLNLPSTQKFGVRIEFQGMDTDTFGILAGFQDGGACNTSTVSAKISSTDRNTYATQSQYNSFGILPTSGGSNIYYDCNGNGGYDAGSNEDDYLQNGAIWLHVTTDPLSVSDIDGAINFNVYPNPSTGEFNINLNAKDNNNVNLTVRDIVGKTIISKDLKVSGQQTETISLADYSSGVYFLTINNETVKLIVE